MASGASRRTIAGRVRADHDRVSRGGSRGLTTPQDTDMWNDEQQAVWTRIVEFGHSQGAALAIHSWPTPDAMPDVSRLPRRARRPRPAR